jgi:hypothetical protein
VQLRDIEPSLIVSQRLSGLPVNQCYLVADHPKRAKGRNTLRVSNVTSALPPKADMCSALAHVCVNLSPDTWKIIQDYVARDSTAFAFYELASTSNLLLHAIGKLSLREEVFNFESL